MNRIIHHMLSTFQRFQNWFDARFGWFFTNGMKERRGSRQEPFKA